MADTKISALTAAGSAAAANELPINEAGTSKKLTVAQLRDLIGVQKAVLTADHAIASATATEVTDLSLTLVAGTYLFEYFLIVSTATTTVGPYFGINYTGTATRFNARLMWGDTGGAGGITGTADETANASTGQLMGHSSTRAESTTTPNLEIPALSVSNTDVFVKIEGVLVVTDGGDLELWHGSESATTTTLESGSSVLVTRMA